MDDPWLELLELTSMSMDPDEDLTPAIPNFDNEKKPVLDPDPAASAIDPPCKPILADIVIEPPEVALLDPELPSPLRIDSTPLSAIPEPPVNETSRPWPAITVTAIPPADPDPAYTDTEPPDNETSTVPLTVIGKKRNNILNITISWLHTEKISHPVHSTSYEMPPRIE